MTVVPVLRQRSYKAAESSYNPCIVLKAHNEACNVRVENIEKKGGLVLAFAGCTDLHDASGHQGAFICRGAVSSACDTACRSACAVLQGIA